MVMPPPFFGNRMRPRTIGLRSAGTASKPAEIASDADSASYSHRQQRSAGSSTTHRKGRSRWVTYERSGME